MSPDTLSRIAWLLDEDSGAFYLQNWLGKMVLGLLFLSLPFSGVCHTADQLCSIRPL